MDFLPLRSTPGPQVGARPHLACTMFTTLADLERLAPAWQALLGHSASNEPVLSPAWMLTWWRVFGALNGRRLRVAGFFDGPELVGLAPLLWRRHWYRPGIPFRRLELLGSGEAPTDAIHPDYLGILSVRGAEERVAGAFAAALFDGQLGSWDELVLSMMDGGSPLLPALSEVLRDTGLSCRWQVTGSASYIPLPATWEEYLQALSASRRAYIRQSLRRFEAWAGESWSLHEVTGPADLAEGYRVLQALHQERWGSEGKFGAPRFTAFHEAMLPQLQEAGALELLWLSVRGEPIVAAYNIVWNGKVHFYQSGRKRDLPAAQRPGIVLHAHAIQRAIAAGRREYDFLSGGEQYKQQLALAMRPIVELRVHRGGLVEQVRRLAEHGIALARFVRRRIRASRRQDTTDPSS